MCPCSFFDRVRGMFKRRASAAAPAPAPAASIPSALALYSPTSLSLENSVTLLDYPPPPYYSSIEIPLTHITHPVPASLQNSESPATRHTVAPPSHDADTWRGLDAQFESLSAIVNASLRYIQVLHTGMILDLRQNIPSPQEALDPSTDHLALSTGIAERMRMHMDAINARVEGLGRLLLEDKTEKDITWRFERIGYSSLKGKGKAVRKRTKATNSTTTVIPSHTAIPPLTATSPETVDAESTPASERHSLSQSPDLIPRNEQALADVIEQQPRSPSDKTDKTEKDKGLSDRAGTEKRMAKIGSSTSQHQNRITENDKTAKADRKKEGAAKKKAKNDAESAARKRENEDAKAKLKEGKAERPFTGKNRSFEELDRDIKEYWKAKRISHNQWDCLIVAIVEWTPKILDALNLPLYGAANGAQVLGNAATYFQWANK